MKIFMIAVMCLGSACADAGPKHKAMKAAKPNEMSFMVPAARHTFVGKDIKINQSGELCIVVHESDADGNVVHDRQFYLVPGASAIVDDNNAVLSTDVKGIAEAIASLRSQVSDLIMAGAKGGKLNR